MTKIAQMFSSRTFWTIVITIVINTVNANNQFIPDNVIDILNPILGLAATYFHINPSQSYKK